MMADRVGRLLMLAATMLFFLIGLVPIVYFSPRRGAFETLSGMGSFTAGAWALGAGILAVYAAWSISARDRELRRSEVATICFVEIQGFWRHLEKNETILTLVRNTSFLQTEDRIPNGLETRRKDFDRIDTYKGQLGWDWLSLSKTPEIFGALPIELAYPVLDFYSRARGIMEHLNWMSDQDYTMAKVKEVCNRQERALNDLYSLEAEYPQIIKSLKILAIRQ